MFFIKNYVIVNHTCLLRCCSEIKKLRHCSSLLCPVTHGVRYIVGSTNRGVEDTKNYRHISTRRPRGAPKTRAAWKCCRTDPLTLLTFQQITNLHTFSNFFNVIRWIYLRTQCTMFTTNRPCNDVKCGRIHVTLNFLARHFYRANQTSCITFRIRI